MLEPVEPSKEDCCNSGCNPCIFDVFEKQLTLYKEYQKRGCVPAEGYLDNNAMSQLSYTEFVIVDNIKLCEEHHLLIFKVNSDINNYKVLWKPGNHFLVKYMTDNYSCSRAYTPLKHKVRSSTEFSVLVKRYNQGVVSPYLCDMKLGEITLWRGPFGLYEVTLNKFDRLIMIAQGTGVAPFFSIIESILSNEDDMTKLILIYCCRRKESILLRDELYSWKNYWNFQYTIYLSISNQFDVYKYQEPIMNHKFEATDLTHITPFSIKDQILLCGSAQFMDHFKEILKLEDCQNTVLL